MRRSDIWALCGAVVLVWPGAALAKEAPAAHSTEQPGALGTEGQIGKEKLALRLLASAPVRAEMARLEALYRNDAQGKTPAGAATIRRAVDSITLAAIQYVVNDDAARPVALWVVNAPHNWSGIDVPRSGYGIDNPDNVYRNIPIDGASRYEIRGRIAAPGPVEQHFVLMDAIPGTTPITAEGGAFLGALRSDQMQIAADGSFVITVDSEPAGTRPNHIQTPAKGHFLMIVRDLFTDWGKQNVIALDVERVGGPVAPPPPTESVLAQEAADLLAKIGPYWVDYDNRFIFSKPANELTPPRHRPGGRGLSASGHFQLADDEALIMTLDPLGATSLGVQVTDPWGVAYEYADRTSSLNNVQAHKNADGTISYVIASADPGVFNWLDPEGYGAGIYAVRWQGLPTGADATRAVRDVRLVKLKDLKAALPVDTRYVNTAERAVQRTERAASHARRLTAP